jgi:ArsR family transcriptional regulator
MQAISEREHCVCELADMVGVDVSTISRHLSTLKNAGIVEGRKQNNQVFYHLIRPCLLNINSCVLNKSE